jgi:hypothetical protein
MNGRYELEDMGIDEKIIINFMLGAGKEIVLHSFS